MRERLHLPIAMWRVHFDLLGGKRRMGLIIAGYVAGLLLCVYMFRRAMVDLPLADFAAGLVHYLIIVQGLILVAGGSTAIYRAMLRDFDTRMLESHRLTPMSHVSVVLGYAFGATLQVLLLAALNLLVGSLFTILAQKPLGVWLGGNAMLFLGALCFWSFTVFIGLRKAKPLNPTVFLAFAGMFGMPAMSIPAIGSFLGAYAVLFGIWIAREDFKIPIPIAAVVGVVSLIVAAFWFHVSAAKFRRPDLPALNGFRGLVLLLLWLALGAIGIRGYVAAAGSIMNTWNSNDLVDAQMFATIIGGMILAWVPISGAVECGLIVGRGGSPRNFGDRMRDCHVTLISVALSIGLPALLAWPAWRDLAQPRAYTGEVDALNAWTTRGMGYGFLPIGIAILSSAFTAHGVFRANYALPVPQRARALVILSVLFALPVLLDLARMGLVMNGEIQGPEELSAISAFSPVGIVLCVLTSTQDIVLLPGLAFQAAVALLYALIGRRRVLQHIHEGAGE